MKIRIIDNILLLITIVLCMVAWVWPSVLDQSYLLFLVIIFTVGIPHGALDHIIYHQSRTRKEKSMVFFYFRYLGLIMVVGIFWLLLPVPSFIVFLLLSAYHFGQSQLYYVKGPVFLKHILFIIWGTFLLSIMITMNFQECLTIFASLEWLQVHSWMSRGLWNIILLVSGIVLTSGFFYIMYAGFISKFRMILELVLLAAFVLLSAQTNVVFTFTIYFGLWHSLRSLVIEYDSLYQVIRNYSIQRFLKQLMPFSILAISFLIAVYYLSEAFIPGVSPYMLFIIIISTLTVPHLMIMYNLYRTYEGNFTKP